jgi:hypothetical protein
MAGCHGLISFLAAGIVLTALAGCHDGRGLASGEAPERGAEAADAAPAPWNPAFVDIDRREHRPAADSAIKAVALVFILPDCPIANSYAPELNRLHDKFGARGIRLLVVHADPAMTPEHAREHAAEYELQPPVVLDPGHEWVRLAGATKTPEAAVFSRSGELLYRGRIDDRFVDLGQRRVEATQRDLREALEAIAAGRPVTQPRTEAVGCFIPELPANRSSGD